MSRKRDHERDRELAALFAEAVEPMFNRTAAINTRDVLTDIAEHTTTQPRLLTNDDLINGSHQ
ncbi:hypothetical protein [Modestobacter sp. I12A-02662]|uniref:hypothetical protein n=1 Tax=Modestobacter sp. I12A-02662 TaxID=1730496 RepID=UPI0034DFD542